MSVKTLNRVFADASAIIHEDEYSLVYRAGTNAFDRPIYNIAVKAWTTWTKEPILYWKDYTTGHGAYGGMDGLITMAKSRGEQARLVHENIDDMDEIVRLGMDGKICWQMIMDLTGHYANLETGEYLGPDKIWRKAWA